MRGIGLGLAAALIAFFSADAMRAATDAATIFARSVMPALFPMMVLGQLGGYSKTERFAQTVAFSFLAGTPASSQRVRRVFGGSGLTPLLAATGVMSPMFFVGSLADWTRQPRAAWIMLGAHWAGALAAAGLCALWDARKKAAGVGLRRQPPTHDASPAPPRPVPLSRALPAALLASAQSLLAVCGAMMLFAIIAGVLRALLTLAFPAWTAQNAPLLAVVHALLEIGGGCAAMAREQMSLPLLCGLCGFGGLSLWLQSLLFVGDIASPAKLLGIRALHGALSYALCQAAMLAA